MTTRSLASLVVMAVPRGHAVRVPLVVLLCGGMVMAGPGHASPQAGGTRRDQVRALHKLMTRELYRTI